MTEESERPEDHGVELQPNEPLSLSQTCMSCGNEGRLSLLLVPDIFFPDVVITCFSCTECGYRDRQMDRVESAVEGVKITCRFKNSQDLKRYVVISAGTEVKIESGEHGVTYTQKDDAVMVVESLIRYVLETLISRGTLPEDPLTEEETRGLDEYQKIALFLQESLTDLDLVLVLEDKKGDTRVLPVGESLEKGTKSLPLEYFTDECVEIVRIEKEDRGENGESGEQIW